MADNIKRFICVGIPTTACNLRCSYCYLRYCHAQSPITLNDFHHDAQAFRKAMSLSRLGGICMFNFTADGETLIDRRILDYIRATLEEGHYVEIVTNATISRSIQEIAKYPKKLLEHLMLKCSFHYLELKSRNLLDVFFNNIQTIRNAGGSITVELMPYDELIPLRSEIFDLCMKKLGAPCHLTVGRDASQPATLPILTKQSVNEYIKTWEVFDSNLFRYKLSTFGKKRHEFCYAGDWMCFLNLKTGQLSQCYNSLRTINIFRNIDEPIPFKAIGSNCCEPHCYNAHAWLTFGCIPDLSAPYYDEMRNRKCTDGTEWLQPKIKSFFHQKFSENNKENNAAQRFLVNIEMRGRKLAKKTYSKIRSALK